MPQRRSPIKVAVCSTHPIQYQVPWLKGLAGEKEIELKAYYGLIPDAEQQTGAFRVPFVWDIPLLEGYAWEALPTNVRRPSLGSFFGNSTPAIRDRLAADTPDVLILSGWNALPMLQAWFAGWRLSIPMLMRCEANAMRRRPLWVRTIHRNYLKSIEGFLAIGESNRRFFVDNGVREDQIWRAPYFVDNERIRRDFDRDAPNKPQLRARWGISPAAFCFLYVGKLEPKKRIFDLINALEIATRSSTVPLHLLVVGSGDLLDGARAMTAEKKLPVTFTGFLNQTELTQAYATGDCLVLPSDFGETWGLVVNEAMVCGLPAIVSDRVGCGPDLVVEGKTGHVVPFADVSALEERMRLLSADPACAAAMGREAARRVASYSVGSAVAGTLEAARAITSARDS